MATVVNPPAESTTPEPNFEPSTWSADQRDTWMNTGSIPQSTPAESTPAKEPQAGATQVDKPAAESAPASQQEQHKGKGAEDRKAQLNAEIQELLRKRAELRGEVEGGKGVKTAESPAAPQTKQPKLEKPVKPVFGEAGHDGETWDQFEARRDNFTEALTEFKAKETLAADRESREKERKAADTAAENAAIEQGWLERVKEAAKHHEDYAEVVTPLGAKDSLIRPGSVLDAFLVDSKVGAEILYYLGKNPEQLKQIAAMSPFDVSRALVKIESTLTPAEPVPAKTPAVPLTKAARPATDLKATNGAPVDELAAAIEANDVERFNEIQNRRDIERRKQGRG